MLLYENVLVLHAGDRAAAVGRRQRMSRHPSLHSSHPVIVSSHIFPNICFFVGFFCFYIVSKRESDMSHLTPSPRGPVAPVRGARCTLEPPFLFFVGSK